MVLSTITKGAKYSNSSSNNNDNKRGMRVIIGTEIESGSINNYFVNPSSPFFPPNKVKKINSLSLNHRAAVVDLYYPLIVDGMEVI